MNDNFSYIPRSTGAFRLARTIILLFCMMLAARPGMANIVVIGDLVRDYTLKPGQTHEAFIELENRNPVARQVRVYQADYKYLANGESFFPAPNTMERTNAGWITFSPKTLTIPPMQKAMIRYLIRTPRDPDYIGTFWSIIMIQEMQDRTPGNRYGVQIVTQLHNTGKIGLEFTSATVVNKSGQRILTVDIENRGNRMARPEMWLEVYNNAGQKVGRFVSGQHAVLPGCGIRREIDISSLPKGSYNSLFIADCGGKDVYGLEIKLVLEGETDAKPAPPVKN